MRYLKIFLILPFILPLSSVSAQNWFTKTYSILLTNTSSKELIDSISFSAIEGSRTDDYTITVDTSLSMIHFSFSTMGGEEASLIMEKEDKKMVIVFGKRLLNKDLYTSQDQTFGEFQNGCFTSVDESFLGLNEKNKNAWLTSHQNHKPISIPAKTILELEFEKYFIFILNHDWDSIVKIDSSVYYKVNYYTSQRNNLFQLLDFADSLNIICLQNIVKPLDSMFKLDFLEKEIWYLGSTKLIRDADLLSFNKDPKLKLFYADFQKLNKEVMPLRSGAINSFGAFHSTLISFNRGKYIIMSERHTMPDVRGSAPDGITFTYFLERVE